MNHFRESRHRLLYCLLAFILSFIFACGINWLYAGGDLQIKNKLHPGSTELFYDFSTQPNAVDRIAVSGTTIRIAADDQEQVVDLQKISQNLKTLEIVIDSEADEATELTVGSYCSDFDHDDPTGLNKGTYTLNPGRNVIYVPVNWYADVIRFSFQSTTGTIFNLLSIKNVSNLSRSEFFDIFAYRVLLCTIAVFCLLYLFLLSKKSERDWLFRHRFLVGACLIALGVLLNLNGSSLSRWDMMITGSYSDVVYGYGQPVRGDEWKTFFPMISSQAYTNPSYGWYNNILRGTTTDVNLVYALPVKGITLLYRPFLAGFILFGTERGLSFFWCARMICLILAMFEFFRIITSDRRLLSFTGAMMIAFSPLVQWWFAINGLVEMLIFGSTFITALYYYLKLTAEPEKAHTMRIKIGLVCLMVLCGGGYIMTMYPAWMVPLAYVYLAMLIWLFIRFRKTARLGRRDLLLFAAGILFMGATLGYVFVKSWDVIQTVSNTVYPGKRVDVGGGYMPQFFFYPAMIHFPWYQVNTGNNVCESVFMYTMFPLGILLNVWGMIRKRKADPISIISLILGSFVAAFCIFGFPVWLAKLSLLSHSFGRRSMAAVDFFQIILLLRGITMLSEASEERPLTGAKKAGSILICIASAVFTVVLASIQTTQSLDEYYHLNMLTVSVIVLIIAIIGVLLAVHRPLIATVILSVVMLINGAFVNPVQIGTGNIYTSDLAQMISEIREQDPDAVWGATTAENYLMMLGVRELNSVNIYPNLDTWKELDTGKLEADDYNRYAHYLIHFAGSTVDKNDQFKLIAQDSIILNLDNQDVVDLGIKYILTTEDLSELSDETVTYQKYGEAYDFAIYQVIS